MPSTMLLESKSATAAASSGVCLGRSSCRSQPRLHRLSSSIFTGGRLPFNLSFFLDSSIPGRASHVALCQATSPCGTFHHLTPAAPFWSSHPQRGRTQATGRGQSEHPREDVHPEEDNEEEFWVYTGDDDDVSSYEDLDEPDDVSVERSHSSERGRGGPGWGNDDRTQRTRGREDSEDSLSEEREYTEADLTAVDKEYEELLRAVQQRQERGADWEDEEEDEDDLTVSPRQSFSTAQNTHLRAGNGQTSPSPRKIKFGGREWDEPRSISATRGTTHVRGQTRGQHQTRPFEDSFARNNSDHGAESGGKGRDSARGQASEPSDSAGRPESVQQPPRKVLSREEARRRDDALMQQRSWWGGGERGSASYGDEYDGRTKGKAWDGASVRRREGADRGAFQGRSSEWAAGGREERSRGVYSEGPSLQEGGGETEVGWDGGMLRERLGPAQEEWAPREPFRREERSRGPANGTTFSGEQLRESVAERDDLADIMDSICGPDTDVRPHLSDGRDSTVRSNVEDSLRGGVDEPRGGLRDRYEERPAERPARSGQDRVRIDASQIREGSSRKGDESPGGSSRQADTGFDKWANSASEAAVGLGAGSILAEESERLSGNMSSDGDDPSRISSKRRKSKPVIPEGGWTAAEESAQARGVFAERVEHRGFVRKVPEFVKTEGKRGVPERRYGAGGDEWARREAKWFGDAGGFQGKRGAEDSENDSDADNSVTSRSYYQAAPGARRTAEPSAPGTFRTAEVPSATGRPQQVVPGWAQPTTAPLAPEEVLSREERQRRFFEQKEQAARKKQADEYHKRGRALLLSRQGTYQKMKRRQDAKRRKKLEYMEMTKKFEEEGLKLYKAPSWLDQKDGELDEEPDDLMEDIGRKLEGMGMLPPRADL